MAQFGKAIQGKQEPRKEIGLIGMAHRTTFVLQSTMAHPSHMIEGFIRGLKARRPALFNLYTSCQPEHGIGDDMSDRQARLAVESRAYPLFRYDPDLGKTPEECFDLDGNPAIDQDWPTYVLKYKQGGREKELEVPMTFADFAITEVRFRKQFRMAPPDTWNDSMVPLAEFLDLAEDEREGKFPYVWSVDRNNELTRLLVAKPMVESCEDRRDFWTMLRSLAGVAREEISREQVAEEVRREVVGTITSGLMQLVGGPGDMPPTRPPRTGAVTAAPSEAVAIAAPTGDYMAPWLDTEECTACDECTDLNSKMFAYNENKKAYIKDANGGPYRDLVKAAEKCTARVIHPGLPRDRSAKNIDAWIKRAEKYN
jgi:pyruvate-ferredoxin/flavodoxin oxidoreductase